MQNALEISLLLVATVVIFIQTNKIANPARVRA